MSRLERLDAAGSVLVTAEAAHGLAARFAGGLRAAGVPEHGRVLMAAPTSVDLLAGVLGALLGGYLPVVVGSALTPRERAELTADVEPHLVLDADGLAALLMADPVPLGERIACRPMHFTSGTSGRPKGVWSGWLAPPLADAWVAEEQRAWGMSASDVYLAAAPMSHSAPLRFPLMTLLAGGSVVVPGAPTADVSSALIEQGVVTSAFLAPALLARILDAGPPASHRMRLMAHAGAPCPAHVREQAWRVFGTKVVREFYGSTEGQFTICTPEEFAGRPGTVGRARPGRELRADDDGRLWCRTPEHARFEYWRDPAKTAETWHGDWFTVGDLGRIDGDGYVYLDGRRGDLIISGGVNVYPAEVERVVLDLPGVQAVCAFGRDDERWGQRVCLAVVGAVDGDAVRDHCASTLAPAKRPKEIHLVAELPLTHSGKVDRLAVPAALGLVG